jgi:hypothetical protein
LDPNWAAGNNFPDPRRSDATFERRGPDALLVWRPLGVGFIDGLHLYGQALKDFINLGRYCGPRSVKV